MNYRWRRHKNLGQICPIPMKYFAVLLKWVLIGFFCSYFKNSPKEVCLVEFFSYLNLLQEITVLLTGKSQICLFEIKKPLAFGNLALQLKDKLNF